MTASLQMLAFSPRDVKKPKRASYYLQRVATDLQVWTRQKLGVTFNVTAPLSLTSSRTFEEHRVQALGGFPVGTPCGGNMMIQAIEEAIGLGLVLENSRRFLALFYFRKPSPAGDQTMYGAGGMVGWERWYGYDRPGMSWMSDHMPWLLCGVGPDKLRERDWDIPWFAETSEAGRGQVGHELLAHGLVAYPDTAQGTGISSPDLYSWPNVGFADDLKAALLGSGYLT